MQKFNEVAMRPTKLADYEGQDKVRKALNFYIKAAKMRGDCLDHTIIYGPSGLGKTTLANIIANEMEANILTVSAPLSVAPYFFGKNFMELRYLQNILRKKGR